MPDVPFRAVLPEVARGETREPVGSAASPEDEIPIGEYALLELYCDEVDCDCPRVFLDVRSSGERELVAMIIWG